MPKLGRAPVERVRSQTARLRDHDAGSGFRCKDLRCPCRRYAFMVQDTDQPHRCRCKHAPADHDPLPPHECRKCKECRGFDSPWVCNCGHPWSRHTQRFVEARARHINDFFLQNIL